MDCFRSVVTLAVGVDEFVLADGVDALVVADGRECLPAHYAERCFIKL